MRLWTIQQMGAWEGLNRDGRLRGSARYIERGDLAAYAWMTTQMANRIGPRPRKTALPVWAWHRWEGTRRPRPDLRSGRHLLKGTRGVRIEFEIPADSVLLSCFDLWHYVLNYWFIPTSVREDNALRRVLESRGLEHSRAKAWQEGHCFIGTMPEALHARISASWDRIFDLDWSHPEYTWPDKIRAIQATFWELRLDQVCRVDEFVAR